jgi:hypothetical protein
MRTRLGSPDPIATIEPKLAPPPLLEDEGTNNWLQAGRSVRLPVGYVIVGLTLAFVVVLLAYIFGHQRGQSTERGRLEERLATSMTPGDLETLDPMVNPASSDGRGVLSSVPPATGPVNSRAKPVIRPPVTPSSWGTLEPKTDPRSKGMTYFVLAETNQSGAVKLAEYCRANGLETYVVLAKNSRRQVIAFPGFQRSSRMNPEVKALEAQIHSIGAKWKKNERGDSDLSDAYPLTYNG